MNQLQVFQRHCTDRGISCPETRDLKQKSVFLSHTAIPPFVQWARRTQEQEEPDTDDRRVQMGEEN